MKKSLKTMMCGAAIITASLIPYNVFAVSQDETVYVKLQSSGALDYVSVNKHLLNDLKDNKLADYTELKEVENINGFEKFAQNGNSVVWDAEGRDIYYTGKTDKELPIQLSVEYRLNGEVKSAEDMLGKAGDVEIKLRYKNLSKKGDLYTPFVVAVSTTLPESSTHKLSVTNGKAITNGSTVMIAALAAPGLYDSLQLEELKSFDEIVIKYETEKFELNDIYNLVTPKFLDQEDLKMFDGLDELYGNMNTLSNSSKELVSGADKLRNGVAELRAAVVSAQSSLRGGGSLIDDKTLNEISYAAASAARQKVAAQQNTIYTTIKNNVTNIYTTKLGGLQATLAGKGQAIAQQMAIGICAKQAEAGVLDAAACQDPAVIMQIITNYGITEMVTGTLQSIQAELMSALDLDELTSQMYNLVYGSMQQVAQETAAATAQNVAIKVADSIQEGVSEKVGKLTEEMIGGIDKLLDGADQLSNGMQRFDREGIQNLNNLINGKVKTTSNKLKRLEKLAEEYNNYSGIADGVEGKTKFILMIEGKK